MTGVITFAILSALGATLVVTKSFLFAKFRELFVEHEYLYVLVNCPQCAATYAGMAAGALIWPLLNVSIYAGILIALGTSFTTSLLGEIIEKVVYEKE